MSGKLIYKKNADGTFSVEDTLSQQTKWVIIEIAGKKGLQVVHKLNDAKEIVEHAIATGQAPAEWYAIVPLSKEE